MRRVPADPIRRTWRTRAPSSAYHVYRPAILRPSTVSTAPPRVRLRAQVALRSRVCGSRRGMARDIAYGSARSRITDESAAAPPPAAPRARIEAPLTARLAPQYSTANCLCHRAAALPPRIGGPRGCVACVQFVSLYRA